MGSALRPPSLGKRGTAFDHRCGVGRNVEKYAPREGESAVYHAEDRHGLPQWWHCARPVKARAWKPPSECRG